MIKEFQSKLDSILDRLRGEVAQLRTGRASPALVEDLKVELYGTTSPLKTLASIASPEPRQIVIQPWDKNALQSIEKAIQNSSLGLNPVTERDIIRLAVPPLTQERRKELVRTLGKHVEEARIQIRRERDEELKETERRVKARELSEDEKFRRKNEIQKNVDEINKKIEEMGSAKEKEIMRV